MRVITFDDRAFDDACRALTDKVLSACSPDVVIGIASGGDYVARKMLEYMGGCVPHYFSVSASRPGHKLKASRGLKRLYSLFPPCVLDEMRKVEARWLNRFGNKKERNFSMNTPEKLTNVLQNGVCKILVVDDAIDSGTTMAGVVKFLQGEYPECEILTAVITITTKAPMYKADFFLHNDCTLVRFPWSNDMKR